MKNTNHGTTWYLDSVEGFQLFNEVRPLVAPRDVHVILKQVMLQITYWE